MTVHEIGKSILKITITDTEVISYFGAYEKLYTMSSNVQYTINLLLRDIIAEHREFFQNTDIKGGIKAVKKCGCEITLYRRPLRDIAEKEYVFLFNSSESLTKAILVLYSSKQTANIKSSLYKMPDSYCLIIKSRYAERIFIMNEFACKKADSLFFNDYVKEYGKPLIINNAVSRYGSAFSKTRI